MCDCAFSVCSIPFGGFYYNTILCLDLQTYPKAVSRRQKATFNILVHLREERNKLQVLVKTSDTHLKEEKLTCDDVVDS